MRKRFAIALFGTLFVCSLAIFSPAASAGHFGQIQTVDGVAIYPGVVPAAVLRQRPGNYPAHEVSRIPSGKHVHHVMLALSDNPGGERITNAVITVRVARVIHARFILEGHAEWPRNSSSSTSTTAWWAFRPGR